MIPKEYFDADGSGVLRLLKEQEWRGIGITQSLGWEHYEVHGNLPFISSTPVHITSKTIISSRASCPPFPTSQKFRYPTTSTTSIQGHTKKVVGLSQRTSLPNLSGAVPVATLLS